MRILVAEDVQKMAAHIKNGLEAEGHAVDVTRAKTLKMPAQAA